MKDKLFRENNMAENMENDEQDADEFYMEQDSDTGAMDMEMEPTPGADEIERLLMEADISDIPKIIIVTNVDVSVYENDNSKEEFEQTFKVYDENATFQYFKSFRRARVNYSSPLFSANARIDLHEAFVCGQRIKCFFFQPITIPKDTDDPHLKLPAPHKQFLISPPASPPVDWEQTLESRPVINYDLIQAIAQLAPGEAHEIHPQSKDQPGIVVHICEDPEEYRSPGKPCIQQTKCPERNT
ncbi:calcipressin-2-like isoform X2 [Dreissena polymorpha]|uniref:calcipressin-2-like isoform X2 n=1 Tax=Dreissena polymorpha TaxID=45954 RepID=UPI0022655DF4|nr:calcipressin-2-like isoform X2 [Dreissena polymorpha]